VKYDVEVAGLKLMSVSTYTLSGSDTVSYPYRTGTKMLSYRRETALQGAL